MSAFVVNRDHIDALVTLAVSGPAEGPSYPGDGYARPWWVRNPEAHWSDPDFGRRADMTEADEYGVMLWTANVRSIHARYPDTAQSDTGTPAYPGPVDFGLADVAAYRWRPTPGIPALHGLSMLACFEYQACEYDEWAESEAYRFCQALRLALIRRLPGYSDAPWEYTRPTSVAS